MHAPAERICRWPARLIASLGLCLLLASPAPAQDNGLDGFDGFVRKAAPICWNGAASHCFELGFAYADRDGTGRLTLDDVERVRDQLEGWGRANRERLAVHERAAIQLGLVILDLVGLETLFDSYDADGDGQLTREELLADVSLDERPLLQVLRDHEGVDWPAVASRLGGASLLLDRLQGLLLVE